MTTRFAFVSLLLMSCPLAIFALGADPIAEKESKPVTLVIDYGDGVQKHFTAIAWKQGLTVLDALRTAQAHPRGIRCEYTGSGATALLTKIDDVANEGRGRNWMYRVNGKLAEVGFGVRQLDPGDSILWKFEVYR